MSGQEEKYIREAFQLNWIAPVGQNINKFEEAVACYLGVNDAVAVSSGTAAIHLALSLLDVGKGDTVFCSSLTFVASANPITYVGAEPVFIDSEHDTWNMSPSALERAFQSASKSNKMPKAVIVVHLYGQCAKMDEIERICQLYDVPIIEDAAESLGSSYKERMSGSMGHIGIFSFNGNKIITSSGGGMLVSNDMELLKKARFLATQARDPARHYEHSVMGYNYRMSNILAGIGRGQMEVLSQRIEKKREIYQYYEEALSSKILFMPELEGTFSNRWLTVVRMSDSVSGIGRDVLLDELDHENIEARPVWKPLHLQPLFKGCSFFAHNEEISVSEKLFQEGLCLPSGTAMSTEDLDRVVHAILRKL